MLAAWTWNQLAHEGGTIAAAMIAAACFAYLTRKGASVLQKRGLELRVQGIATGLPRKGTGGLQKRRRFSVLDLLVVVTLVAALAGLFKGMANEEKSGMPRFRFWREIAREVEEAKQQEK
jgi:hypothetical protein